MKQQNKKAELMRYYESLCCAWTYERMTQQEKDKFADLIDWIANTGPLDNMNTIREIRYLVLTAYHSFLSGIGYTGANWREPKKENNKQ